MLPAIYIDPVGIVHSPRSEPIDDHWGTIRSTIELDTARFADDSLAELHEFSHVEVVFCMHRVPVDEINTRARRPRDNVNWPLVGIFAQRGKGRPNRIGVSRCRLLGVHGVRLDVQGLDAIDGSPVLDIKPWMSAFGPDGAVREPQWAKQIMKDYY
jgi:tRNA (adenine37-N6)-methyltransferase